MCQSQQPKQFLPMNPISSGGNVSAPLTYQSGAQPTAPAPPAVPPPVANPAPVATPDPKLNPGGGVSVKPPRSIGNPIIARLLQRINQ